MVGVIAFAPLANALLGVFKILVSPEVRGFFGGNEKYIERLKIALLTVQAVLSDAEEKEITNPAVEEWINELKHSAYDADDLLNEIATEASKFKLLKKVTDLFSAANPFYEDIKSRLEKIVQRLEILTSQRDLLKLKGSLRGKPPTRWQTTSLVEESEVFGRDEDKEKLIKSLLDANAKKENGIPVIAIVGIAGVGKTTLAQLLYNDSRVEKNFNNLRVWAHVSEEFDVFKITKTIFESITSSICYVTDLNVLQLKLKNRLRGQRFLVVLDDVWNDNLIDWDLLSIPLKTEACEGRVIVTTRHQGVASIMRAIATHHLQPLLEKDCLSLFEQHAFRTSNSNEHPNLKRIGTKIVKNCNGLPLAAKTLGGILHGEVEVEEWRRIRKSNIWDLPNDKSSILPALRLSYYHLPPHVRQCFAYCSILPKGYRFEKEKLILLWMAEGFLEQSNGKDTMEDVGDNYFRELLSRSFFQPSTQDKRCFVMHDLVNDLAQFAAGEFCFKIVKKNQPYKIPEKARHIAWLKDHFIGSEKFDTVHDFKSIRTVLLLSSRNSSKNFALNKVVVEEWLPKSKSVRVLSFSGCAIYKLPDLTTLIHLRYLDLSDNLISELPDSTCSLYNLQTLLLLRCTNLAKLPAEFCKLARLRHLDVSKTKLTMMPANFLKLKDLQVLTDFFVSKNVQSSKISELGWLSHLRSTLSISKLENVTHKEHASEAKLESKKCLSELVFQWTTITTAEQVLNEEILSKLRPHKNLKKLTIENYGGSRFPDWLCGAILSNMLILKLHRCNNCVSFPSLGQLSSLQELYIKEMTGLTSLRSGLNRPPGLQLFRSLKILSFKELPNWSEWTHEDEDEDFSFPSLQELQIHKCPNLIGSFPKHLSSLKKLDLSHCTKLLPFSKGRFPIHRKEVQITDCNNHLPKKEWGLHGMNSLTRLEIEGGCSGMKLFPEEGLLPDTLEYLGISKLPDLKYLGKGLQHLTSLEIMEINSCENLESIQALWLPTSLSSLHIENCSLLAPECRDGGKEWQKISHILKFTLLTEIAS